jgi:hypothetical protein
MAWTFITTLVSAVISQDLLVGRDKKIIPLLLILQNPRGTYRSIRFCSIGSDILLNSAKRRSTLRLNGLNFTKRITFLYFTDPETMIDPMRIDFC